MGRGRKAEMFQVMAWVTSLIPFLGKSLILFFTDMPCFAITCGLIGSSRKIYVMEQLLYGISQYLRTFQKTLKYTSRTSALTAYLHLAITMLF